MPASVETDPIFVASVHTSPDLSVVIPAYNHARYVAAALESVRTQSLGPCDLTVVDDGSTDGTAEIAEGIAIPGLTVIRQQNLGAHAAMNRAMAHARGSWIGILDSDDLYEPDRLEHALGVARATGAVLVLGRVHLVDEEGATLPGDHPTQRWYAEALEHVARSGSLAEALTGHNVAVTTSNFFVHRELWRRVGGFRPYRYVHDLDFLLRALALAPDRVVFDETLAGVLYRVHAGNTIRENVDRALAERADMLRAHGGLARRAGRAVCRPAAARALRRALEAPAPPRAPGGATAHPSAGAEGAVRCGLVTTTLDAGGLEEALALLALALPAQGVEPHILCSAGGGAVADRLARAGVPVAIARDRGQRQAWVRKIRPQVLSSHFAQVDVLADLCAGGVPAVETVHNTYVWLSADDWARERQKQRWLRALVAVSETAGAYYRRRVTGSAPLQVIPNGVLPDRVCEVPRAFARRTLGLPADAPVLVQLGRLAPQKNQRGLVAAFRTVCAHHPDAVLLLAGSLTDPDYARAVRHEASSLMQEGRVRLLPPRADVGVLLSAADAFVSNSWFEGWSLGATEALWAGLPLVVSDCGGSREMVGLRGARGTLVPNPAGDPMGVTLESLAHPDAEALDRNRLALIQALLKVLADLPVWAARRPAIRCHARVCHTAAGMAQRYAEVVRQLVG